MKIVDELGSVRYRYSYRLGDPHERGKVRENAAAREPAENAAALARLENLLADWEPEAARIVSLYLCKVALKWTDTRCGRVFNVTVNTVKRWRERIEHSAASRPAFKSTLERLAFQMSLLRRSP